ncbi:hypothetical protein ES705_40902 [subsurface metagenome]
MPRRAEHCHLSNAALEWINGELLGDGHLRCLSFRSAKFMCSSKHLEYINYISDTLAQFGIMQAGKIQRRVTCSVTYCYDSLSYTDLLDVWFAWYVYGSKQIPKDLELTPIVCRQWYIGDGSICKTSAKNPYLRIATQGFPVIDVLGLVIKLKQLGFVANRNSDNTLLIPVESAKDFLRYIGKCPAECYEYKWDY